MIWVLASGHGHRIFQFAGRQTGVVCATTLIIAINIAIENNLGFGSRRRMTILCIGRGNSGLLKLRTATWANMDYSVTGSSDAK